MSSSDASSASQPSVWRIFGPAIGLVLLATLGLEVVCRILTPVYLFNPDKADAERGERYPRLRANHRIVSSTAGTIIDFTTNSDGYRDLEFPRGHPCLVLGFGNSFAVNWGVHPDDLWTRQIEARLPRDAAGNRCAVRMVGFQGWTATEVYEAAHDLLPELRPRVVIFLFNQQQMWTPHPPPERPFGEARPEGWEPFLFARRPPRLQEIALRIYNAIERHSALLGAVKVRLRYLPVSLGMTQLQIRGVFPDDEYEMRRDPTLATLDAFAALTREANVELVLAVAPAVYEVDETYRYMLLAARGGTDRGVDFDRPRRTLLEWAERRGIAHVDLLGALREHNSYSSVNYHWNEAGNRIVGETLAPTIAELLAD